MFLRPFSEINLYTDSGQRLIFASDLGDQSRWRLSEYAATASVLGNTFSCSLDTFCLFRDQKWCRSIQQSVFSLSELHACVFNEYIVNFHKIIGYIKGVGVFASIRII